MPKGTSIANEGAAYRRGIVLGLTMAEIMLLLVFCLMIALSVLFSRQKQRNDMLAAELSRVHAALDEERAHAQALQDKVKDLNQQIADLTQLLNKLQIAGAKPDEDWRELVEARKLVDGMRKAGADPQQIAQYAAQLQELVKLLSAPVQAADITQAWRQIQQAKAELKTDGLSDIAGTDLAKAIVEGAKAERDKKQGMGAHDWPPIISLNEASGYSFAVGKADLTPEFEDKLDRIVISQVADIVARYNVDIVEVIGHTDEQPVSNRTSNLDGKLIPALDGNAPIDELNPADNTGLGMARAVSVAMILRRDPRLKNVTVLPLSAAQMIMPGDKVADGSAKGDVKERRRIEIRVRRSIGKVMDTSAGGAGPSQ